MTRRLCGELRSSCTTNLGIKIVPDHKLIIHFRTVFLFFTFALALSNLNVFADEILCDPMQVVGVEEANCAKCHPSEFEQWQKTTHFRSVDRLKYSGNSKKYVDALRIDPQTLMSTSVCADCHGTKSIVDSNPVVVSGVSCESCHGGAKDWLKPHGEYFNGQTFSTLANLRSDRKKETEEHRVQRIEQSKSAGMIRSEMLVELGQNCLGCHLINNEILVLAGHKSASAFELSSWSSGEIRHNFLLDPETNALAPSLWMETHHSTPAARNRMKFVVGAMAQLAATFEQRSNATNTAYIPQVGGAIAAQNGKLAQINALSGTPETQAASALVTPMLGTLFIAGPTDKSQYHSASEQVSELTRSFAEQHDGHAMQTLDTLLNLLRPHYSAKYSESLSN